MNDHNLDDLIIDNIEPRKSKTKSFLTIIALLIVVLIIAIILTKIILKDPNAQKLAFEENNTEMISPELTLQSATEPEPIPKPIKEETKLSTIIENELKAPSQVEEVSKETVEITKEIIKVPEQPKAKNSTKEEERLQKEKEYNEAKRAKLAQEKAAQKKAEEERLKLEKAEQKRVAKEKAAKEKAAKVKPAVKPKPVSSQVYYIQVGSFTKTPSTQFLNIIKKSGFNYQITPKAANGTKKLLIGPYKNRASADTALARVKDRINKNAFVVKK
jgi:DedD protein